MWCDAFKLLKTCILVMAFFENFTYPSPVEDKIDTLKFLEASKGIVKFVELLGAVFSPVKHDIEGNVDKLLKIYNQDMLRFKYLVNIIEYEHTDESKKVGIDALLWLKRALEYVQVFLTCMVNDYNESQRTEDLSSFFNKAYEEKLKMYHGWFVQKIFGVIVLAAPTRKTLLKMLTDGKSIGEEEIFRDIENFLQGLSDNLTLINEMYRINNLDSSTTV